MRACALCLLALLSLAAGVASGQDSAEASRIRHLIAAVETLEGARFIRNGREYDATAAADHLRLKLKAAGDRVKTAEDFIRLCGSRSSLSGDPYRIRFADGKTTESERFFRDRLKAYAPEKP